MPDLTITLDAEEVLLITTALHNTRIDHDAISLHTAALAYKDLLQRVIDTWVEQNPEESDLPWRA